MDTAGVTGTSYLPRVVDPLMARLLTLLERVFILEAIPPWAVSLRSKARSAPLTQHPSTTGGPGTGCRRAAR